MLHIKEVDSTNTFLKELVKEGSVQPPFCVSADMQTQGKGQRGNHWISESGSNITASFLFPKIEHSAKPAILNFIAANALLEVLENNRVRQVKVKWPNDIYIGDLKMAGILTENVFEGDRLKYSILGIGLNVNQLDFDDDVNATSLRAITGKAWDRDQLLLELYIALYNLKDHDSTSLVNKVNERLYKANKSVTFMQSNKYYDYQVLRINNEGQLVVLDGKKEKVIEHHVYKWIK